MTDTTVPLNVRQAHWCKPHSPKVGTLTGRLTDDNRWVPVCPFRGERIQCDIVKVTVTVTEVTE